MQSCFLKTKMKLTKASLEWGPLTGKGLLKSIAAEKHQQENLGFMERYIKFFLKQPSTQRTSIWEYYMNHPNTEKGQTPSSFSPCPMELHTGVCSGLRVSVPSECSESSCSDQAGQGWSQIRCRQHFSLCHVSKPCICFQWWVPNRLSGHFTFSYLKREEALYTLKATGCISRNTAAPCFLYEIAVAGRADKIECYC